MCGRAEESKINAPPPPPTTITPTPTGILCRVYAAAHTSTVTKQPTTTTTTIRTNSPTLAVFGGGERHAGRGMGMPPAEGGIRRMAKGEGGGRGR